MSDGSTEIVSVLRPEGYYAGRCGYCSPPGERSKAHSNLMTGITPVVLTCADYQMMIDRGWRRSGDHTYKPDLRRSCCPQYTIRLDALQFSPTRSQRKALYRWNRFVEHTSEDDMDAEPRGPKGAKASKKGGSFDLTTTIHESEAEFCKDHPAHRFEVTLERASYTDEKFELYLKYQREIHNDKRESPSGFSGFLVISPLEYSPIEYKKANVPDYLPREFGSYHQLYRLDGKLIAMAVIDILPSCVSSVYFMYDTDYERFSFGKLSAMREASLAREMHEHGATGVQFAYMGFYIHSCPKMRYKAEYAPSFLLDPEEYTWYPFKDCIGLLDKYRYACFSHPEHSLAGSRDPGILPAGQLSTEDQLNIRILADGAVEALSSCVFWFVPEFRSSIQRAIEGLGVELSKEVVFTLD